MFFSYINEIYLVADIWWNVSLDGSGVGKSNYFVDEL